MWLAAFAKGSCRVRPAFGLSGCISFQPRMNGRAVSRLTCFALLLLLGGGRAHFGFGYFSCTIARRLHRPQKPKRTPLVATFWSGYAPPPRLPANQQVAPYPSQNSGLIKPNRVGWGQVCGGERGLLPSGTRLALFWCCGLPKLLPRSPRVLTAFARILTVFAPRSERR